MTRDLYDRSLDLRCQSQTEAVRYCRRLAGGHYENFTVVLPGLSEDVSRDLEAIYAYCRWADDLADEIEDPRESVEKMERFQSMLERVYNGEMIQHPVFRALSGSIRRNDLPKNPFLDLLSAFKQDRRQTRYETFEDLVDYCQRSANPVGRLFLKCFDVSTERNRYFSDKTCTALQLTNFWADVPIDEAKNRIYIPGEDMERFGVTEEIIRDREFTPAFQKLMAYEVERTRDWFRVGWQLVEQLSGPIALAIELFNAGGWTVLDTIEEHHYNVFQQRWTLDDQDKYWIGLRGLWRWAAGSSVPPS
ncbi:MAG: squalene synthase HpnC [bacterium]